jgi:hypothetical protein
MLILILAANSSFNGFPRLASILARDGAGREELEGVADIAMAGWDARLGRSAT